MSQNTSNVQSWKSEFEKRLNLFAEKIRIDSKKVHEVFSEYFGADGSGPESLEIIDVEENSPFGDLRAAFVDSGLTKIGLLRLGIPFLRSKKQYASLGTNGQTDDVAGTLRELVEQNRPVSKCSDRELIAQYSNGNKEIRDELIARSKSRPFLFFNSDGSVDVHASEKALKIARKQPTDEIMMVDGSPRLAQRAGVYYEKPVNESPLAPGKVLVNEYCAETGTNWTGVPTRIRQMVRVLIDTLDWHTSSIGPADCRHICDVAHKGESEFKKTFPKVIAAFEKLERQGDLPRLKISPDSIKAQERIDRGFI